MMNRNRPRVHTLLMILTAVLTLFFFSCQTAPEEEPAEEEPTEEMPAEEEPTPEEEEAEAPQDARNTAENLRSYITEHELAQYAEASFSTAEERHQEAESAYGSDNERSAQLFDETIELYRDVLEKSVKSLRSDYKEQVAELRDQAESLKASSALPEEYQASMNLLEQTENAFEEGNYRKAHELSLKALEQLKRTVNRAQQKRQKAVEALQKSQSSLEDTERQIQQFEEEAALEDETEGETEE